MRSPDFERTVIETLNQHGLLLVALLKQADNQRVLTDITNERLEQVITLLTPEEAEPRSGPTLVEVVQDLVAKIERQNVLVKDLADTTVQSFTALPQALAEAILEAEADAAARDASAAEPPA